MEKRTITDALCNWSRMYEGEVTEADRKSIAHALISLCHGIVR